MLLTLETLDRMIHSKQLKLFEAIASIVLSASILALSVFLVLANGVTLNSGLGRFMYASNFLFYWLQATSAAKFFDDAVGAYVATLRDHRDLSRGLLRDFPTAGVLRYFAFSGVVRVTTQFFASSGNLPLRMSVVLRYFVDMFLRVLVNVLVVRIGYVMRENQRELRKVVVRGKRDQQGRLYRQLYRTCRRHFKLCGVFDDINALMVVQTLCYFAITVQHVVYSFYAAVNSFFKNHQDEFNFYRANDIVMGVIEGTDVCLLIYNCTVASETANETVLLIHKLRSFKLCLELERHIQMYSLQMLHCKVKFSVLGLFQIDYSLFYSIFGGLATYLVLLIQFNDNGGGNHSGTVTNVTKLN